MQISRILTIADKNEEKFLRTKTADFNFDIMTKKELNDLIKKMKEMMIKANGIGLSANQIGLNIKMFIALIPQNYAEQMRNYTEIPHKSALNPHKSAYCKFYAIFNPEIIKISKKTEIMEEGCLSAPNMRGEVERPKKITLTGFDKNGRKIKIKAEGLTARVFQHEIDHLNGILFIDKAMNIKKVI